jgi:chemotaxis signal transduction protein
MLVHHAEALDQDVFEAYLGGLLQESLKQNLVEPVAAVAAALPAEPIDPLCLPFKALRCQVGTQQVLLPLMHLNAVTFFPEKLWQTENNASTDLGILSYRSHSLRILDFSKFINPKALVAKRSNIDYGYILLFPEYRLGFACEQSLGIELLMPESIRRKEQEGKMSWHLGFWQQDLSPIVKLDRLAALISQKSC